jgi:hypothetical protein
MRLDHVSYVTSHDQLADTVQRLGSRLGSTFVDGGIHPRFGSLGFLAQKISHLLQQSLDMRQQKVIAHDQMEQILSGFKLE